MKAVVNKLMEVERESIIPTQALMEALGETGGNREYLLRRVEAFAKRNRQVAGENKELKENLKLLEENDNECISHEAAGGVFALAP